MKRLITGDEISKKEFELANSKLKQLNEKRKSVIWIYLFMVIGIIVGLCVYEIMLKTYTHRGNLATYISVLAGFFVGLVLFFLYRLYNKVLIKKYETILIEYASQDMIKDINKDIFENSIKMSYKYLDQYYLQTREQAEKGFFVTLCVAIFGGILITVGIIAMLAEKTNPSYISIASGIIIEFIASIFFYLYSNTVSSMSKYHNKLVLSQNISIALKVSDTLPEPQKTSTKEKIISELLENINSYLITSEGYKDKKH